MNEDYFNLIKMLVQKPTLITSHHLEVSRNPQFYYVFLLLRITGFYFKWPKSRILQLLSILFPASMLILAIYKTCFLIIYLCSKNEYDHVYAGMFVIFNGSIKYTFIMIFLIYCRYRKYHKRLLEKLNEFSQQYDSDKILLYNRIIMGVVVSVFIGCIFAGTVTSVLANDQEHNERIMIDRKAQKMIFHVKISPFLSMLVTFYGFFVWLATLTCYMIITNILSAGFESFNKGLKRKLKCANENSIEKILQESYTTHLKITENVYLVNNVFEVYTFVSFGLNIPLTMVSLVSAFLGFKASWASALFTIPTLFFSLIELIFLTIFPAKIRSNIRGIQKILFGTPTIWTPYNEKTYQIANAFVNHVNQDDLGISLWGFTIISNRLILTTLSLTITYLALLVQMKGIN